MKAMILAAGLGTRLKPITDKIPKALVEVGGVPMLERVIDSLRNQGFNEIVVNVHHFSAQVKEFLGSKDFGVHINISDESDSILDTGGGIVKASSLLFENNDEPVLIYNVDILSNAKLKEVMDFNPDGGTLLVSDRDSTRKLMFNDDMELKGWENVSTGEIRPSSLSSKEGLQAFAFSGVYTLGKQHVEEMKRLLGTGKYSVTDYFLHVDRKLPLWGYKAENLKLIDIGKPATLLQARETFDKII